MKNVAQKICIIGGSCLILVAIAALILWQWNIHAAEKKAKSYAETLLTLIPQRQNAVPEERGDNGMSALSIEETDFIGLLEMPRYSSALPVCAAWGDTAKFPCRFSGSIYDRSLKIGATTQKGQFDFYREISVGDAITFTDMEGNQFNLTVSDIRYTKHADASALNRAPAALTLFLKNEFAIEYLILSCDVPQ